MEKPELYIPPCCMHRQLPELIRSGGLHSIFYSQGDWGLPKLLHAVSSLVPHQDGSVLTLLVMPAITLTTIRWIETELRHHWSEVIILVTATDMTGALRDNLSPEDLQRICYCPKRLEAETANIWHRQNPLASLTVCGPISPQETGPGKGTMCQYTASFIHKGASGVPGWFAPWRAIIRRSASLRGVNPLIESWVGPPPVASRQKRQ